MPTTPPVEPPTHTQAAAKLNVTTTPPGGRTRQWTLTRITYPSSDRPFAQFVSLTHLGGHATVALAFTPDGIQLNAAHYSSHAGDIASAHPHPFPLDATREVLRESVADVQIIANLPGADALDREDAVRQLAGLRLVERAYRYCDATTRSVALAVITAGFAGTPDELETAIAGSSAAAAH